MAHRAGFNFSYSALSMLEKLAHEKGKSMSDVFRDAIVLENYITEAAREGSKIYIERPDGKIRELIAR
jgi:hypothetical protein